MYNRRSNNSGNSRKIVYILFLRLIIGSIALNLETLHLKCFLKLEEKYIEQIMLKYS